MNSGTEFCFPFLVHLKKESSCSYLFPQHSANKYIIIVENWKMNNDGAFLFFSIEFQEEK